MPCPVPSNGCLKMDTDLRHFDPATAINTEASRLGFSACGYASIHTTPPAVIDQWQSWIAEGKHGPMSYMANHASLRSNVEELLPGAKTVISLALNYFPKEVQPTHHPQFAYYAYGSDYHDIMRCMMQQLADYIRSLAPCDCRICCDTAPLFERYWAQQAGIGFRGLNSQLIVPQKGSYFFLGEILTTLSIAPSQPCQNECGSCRRCIEACPVGAICGDGTIDARRCISCQTIENRGEIPTQVVTQLGRRLYGCDTCQQVCPHNRHATPTTTEALQPSAQFMALDYNALCQLTPDAFREIFRHSAIKRAKYDGLMRNLRALDVTLFD